MSAQARLDGFVGEGASRCENARVHRHARWSSSWGGSASTSSSPHPVCRPLLCAVLPGCAILAHSQQQRRINTRALCESRHAESARTLDRRECVDSSVLCQAFFPTRGSRWLRVVRSLRWRRLCPEALVGLPQDPPTHARAGNMNARGCSVSDCQTHACVATIRLGRFAAEAAVDATVSHAAPAAFLGRVQGQRRCCPCQ